RIIAQQERAEELAICQHDLTQQTRLLAALKRIADLEPVFRRELRNGSRYFFHRSFAGGDFGCGRFWRCGFLRKSGEWRHYQSGRRHSGDEGLAGDHEISLPSIAAPETSGCLRNLPALQGLKSGNNMTDDSCQNIMQMKPSFSHISSRFRPVLPVWP